MLPTRTSERTIGFYSSGEPITALDEDLEWLMGCGEGREEYIRPVIDYGEANDGSRPVCLRGVEDTKYLKSLRYSLEVAY